MYNFYGALLEHCQQYDQLNIQDQKNSKKVRTKVDRFRYKHECEVILPLASRDSDRCEGSSDEPGIASPAAGEARIRTISMLDSDDVFANG